MTIVFVMNDNRELRMKCKEFTIEKNGVGMITGWQAKGVTENKPIYMPIGNVKMIYRVMSDESEEGEE